MNRLRVAYVVNVFPKLSETFIAHELAELRRRGVEVTVLSLRVPTESLRHEVVTAGGLDRLTAYDSEDFHSILRAFRPQLLHAHFATEPAAAARALARELGVPFTFTAHGYDIHRRPPEDFGERAAAAGRVITVSRANARHLAETFGVPERHVEIVPCGVDTAFFRPPESPPVANPPLLVCVARLVPVKNLELLLRACAIVRDREQAFACVLVGDGGQRAALETLRDELGLGPHVRFVGAAEQNEVRGWWHQAAVGLLTSNSEGMPVCLMEAAACGVPAVATAVGGVPELVEHGVTGLLAPAGDAEALAAAIRQLLTDPARARTMGRAARGRAEKRFSLSGQIDRLMAIWQEVLR